MVHDETLAPGLESTSTREEEPNYVRMVDRPDVHTLTLESVIYYINAEIEYT